MLMDTLSMEKNNEIYDLDEEEANWLHSMRKKKKYIDKAKIYIKDPSDAPTGANVQRGPRGGYYYESTQTDAKDKTDAIKDLKRNPLILLKEPEYLKNWDEDKSQTMRKCIKGDFSADSEEWRDIYHSLPPYIAFKWNKNDAYEKLQEGKLPLYLGQPKVFGTYWTKSRESIPSFAAETWQLKDGREICVALPNEKYKTTVPDDMAEKIEMASTAVSNESEDYPFLLDRVLFYPKEYSSEDDDFTTWGACGGNRINYDEEQGIDPKRGKPFIELYDNSEVNYVYFYHELGHSIVNNLNDPFYNSPSWIRETCASAGLNYSWSQKERLEIVPRKLGAFSDLIGEVRDSLYSEATADIWRDAKEGVTDLEILADFTNSAMEEIKRSVQRAKEGYDRGTEKDAEPSPRDVEISDKVEKIFGYGKYAFWKHEAYSSYEDFIRARGDEDVLGQHGVEDPLLSKNEVREWIKHQKGERKIRAIATGFYSQYKQEKVYSARGRLNENPEAYGGRSGSEGFADTYASIKHGITNLKSEMKGEKTQELPKSGNVGHKITSWENYMKNIRLFNPLKWEWMAKNVFKKEFKELGIPAHMHHSRLYGSWASDSGYRRTDKRQIAAKKQPLHTWDRQYEWDMVEA